MSKLNDFLDLLIGNFDNKEQYVELKSKGITYPYCRHVNTLCNNKIKNLPNDFKGQFLVEESYYTVGDKTHCSPHLFLFTEDLDGIRLRSYDIPKEYNKNTFTYNDITEIDYNELEESKRFVPAIYKEVNGVYEGGSESRFTPVMKFILFEKFSKDHLEVTERMEVNGKKTFGEDEPIIYKRI